MGAGLHDEEKEMSRTLKKMIHVGHYVAEVNVALEESTDDWAPYISLQDALRVDKVREALQRGDIDRAQLQFH